MLKKMLLIGLMLLPAIAIPVQADHGCDYTWEYIGPREVVFVCGHGWTNPLVHVEDLASGGLACFDVEQENVNTIIVKIMAACLSPVTGEVGASTAGTIYVEDGA